MKCPRSIGKYRTQSAIVTSGRAKDVRDGKPVLCAKVEVYSSETFQWHTTKLLPVPCGVMTSVTIADTWYLLGGAGNDYSLIPTVVYTPLTALVQKATSPTHQSASPMSVWKTLPETPLKASAGTSLSGNLLAVGGYMQSQYLFLLSCLHFLPPHQLLGQGHHWRSTKATLQLLEIYQSHTTTALQYSYYPTNCWWLVGEIARKSYQGCIPTI